MNTIKGISERILRILNGGNVQKDSQFHQLDIEYMVRDMAATLIKADWFNERNEGGVNIDSRYVFTFSGIEVKVDEITKENYVDVPVDSYIKLPRGQGIHSVRPDPSGTNAERTKYSELKAFIPIPIDFEDIFYALPAGSLEQQYGWMVRGNKIFFTKRAGKTLIEYDISKVIVRVVTTDPKAIAYNEPLPLSSESVERLFKEVLNIFTSGKPQLVDVINDDNPNITKAE